MNLSLRPRFLPRAANPSGRRVGGFTIIELLVATAITALLVSLMLNVVVNVMSGWSRSSGTLTTGGQARTILNQLATDLQGAILKRDGNVWFAATIQQNQSGKGDAGISDASWPAAGKPSGVAQSSADNASYYIPVVTAPATPDLTAYRFGQAGVWLRFFTGVSDTNSGLTNLSSPRAVSYQIVRMPIITQSKEVRYLLFRSEVRPGDTAGSPNATTSTFGQGYDLFAAKGYNDPTVGGTNLADAGNIRRPRRELIIGNNVVDFGVRVWDSSTGTLLPKFPTSSKTGYAATTNDGNNGTTAATPLTAPASGAINPVSIAYGFPEVVEIFVRILTDDGVKQLALLEQNLITLPTGETWWSFVEKNSQVYTRRVEIKSQAL